VRPTPTGSCKEVNEPELELEEEEVEGVEYSSTGISVRRKP
jgi:hypothetical protein